MARSRNRIYGSVTRQKQKKQKAGANSVKTGKQPPYFTTGGNGTISSPGTRCDFKAYLRQNKWKHI